MTSDPMAYAATLFIGPDMEGPTRARDTRFFERVDLAVRYAVKQVPHPRRYGMYIRVQDGHGRQIEWDEIEELYAKLGT